MKNAKKEKWISIFKEMPKPYDVVEAKGVWECESVLYVDDDEDGWEQKMKGNILVTHWKRRKK